ncbi:hypothetical protein [Kribbella italica]|uniref:Uncharacterized protein n=1 Tax=Kribbella italica TaxID=1540520 RepID=A0A7W9JD14_9ACTN|nr:hypothetical protein [Kribbella italica]MBB5839914.1 hypothetical protein [Kribbella italica]
MSDARLTLAGVLEAPAGHGTLVSVGMGPDGPAAVWSSSSGAADILGRQSTPDGASYAATRTATSPSAVLVRHAADGSILPEVTVVDRFPVAHPLVQPMPDGGYLIVGARCRWSDGTPEQNAIVYSRDGVVERTGTLGDGVEHLQVDDDGRIWAGYADEGVLGAFGWNGPGPLPLGAPGVVRWSPTFDKQWEFPSDDVWIDACYALNVSGDTVLACPYADFPVLRIRQGEVEVGTTSAEGPNGIVAAGDTVGLIGSYDEPGSVLVGRLTDGQLESPRTWSLTMPDGSPVPPVRVTCRGSVAHFFVGTAWLRFTLTGGPPSGPRPVRSPQV